MKCHGMFEPHLCVCCGTQRAVSHSHCFSLPVFLSALRWRDRHEWWRLAQVGFVCWQKKKVEKGDDSISLMCFSLSFSVRHTQTHTLEACTKCTHPGTNAVTLTTPLTSIHTQCHTRVHTEAQWLKVWMRLKWADTNSVAPVSSREKQAKKCWRQRESSSSMVCKTENDSPRVTVLSARFDLEVSLNDWHVSAVKNAYFHLSLLFSWIIFWCVFSSAVNVLKTSWKSCS